MKKLSVILCLSAVVVAFRTENSTIKGRIVPETAALNVWAVSDRDTFKTLVQTGGEFEFKEVKPGLYRVIVEGRSPYKVTTKTDVNVTGGYIDIGNIIVDK